MRCLALLFPLAAVLLTAAQAGATASQTAQYELRFDATWSAATHPLQFPGSPHFSPLIGGTHSNAIAFWEEGSLASFGIEQMAETGSTAILTQDVNAAIAAGDAGAVVSGGGVAPSPGSRTLQFSASQAYRRLTLVTMVAPSPDWFVGINGLELFNGSHWIESAVVTLPAYDAGTDDGSTYLSPDRDSSPHVPIAVILSDPLGGGTLGTYTITRLDADPAPATALSPFQLRLLALALLIAALALLARQRFSPPS